MTTTYLPQKIDKFLMRFLQPFVYIKKDGTKLLIGTQKPSEAATILKALGHLNPNDFV